MCVDDYARTVARFVTLSDADGAHDERDDAIEHRSSNVADIGGSLDIRVHGGDDIVAVAGPSTA